MGMGIYLGMVRRIIVTEKHSVRTVHIVEPVFINGQVTGGFRGEYGDFKDGSVYNNKVSFEIDGI